MLQQHLWLAGPVIYPLLVCSVLLLALLLERLLVLLSYPPLRARWRQRQFMVRLQREVCADMALVSESADVKDSESDPKLGKPRGLAAGFALLELHRHGAKARRDEYLSLWLQAERRKLLARSRWLTLIGTLAPLLGLLGTVLGIVTMFQQVAHQAGPVTPALLAEGMWQAMVTTALGMLIAIPALAAGQVIAIWGDQRIARMQQVLNESSLWLAGRSCEGESLPSVAVSPRMRCA